MSTHLSHCASQDDTMAWHPRCDCAAAWRLDAGMWELASQPHTKEDALASHMTLAGL